MSICLALGLLFSWTSPAHSAECAYEEVVVFGDSLSDDGNLFAATGGALPPSPPYYGGRFSNGEVWVERLADSLGSEPGEVALLNFAVGGAQTGYGLKEAPPSFPVGPGELRIPAMGAQIAQYLGRARPSDRTLFVLFGGSNDIFFGDAGNEAAVRNLGHHLRRLAKKGAREFLVPNLPPLDLTPYGQSLDPEIRFFLSLAVADFNQRLERELGRDERRLDVRIHRFDVDSLFRAVVDDPQAYGFVDTAIPAILLPSTVPPEALDAFLFWDDVHPTRAGHALLAAEAEALMQEASSVSSD